jgi:hypothetical protein
VKSPQAVAERHDAGAPPAPAEHGHRLLEQLLSRVAGRLKHGYLVEVGTTREKVPGQGSTVILATLAARLGLPFVTVDMDPANSEQAATDLDGIPNARAVTAKGEDFLAQFDQPVAAAYLDAFDIQHGKHSKDRVERYRRILGTEITNDGAAAMHLACARALITRVVPGGIVVIDDTWPDGDGYAGKGRDAVPAFLAAGFHVAAATPTAIALEKRRPPKKAVGPLRRAVRRVRRAVRRRVR